MLVIRNTSTDPYFNMAVEEYLLKQKDDDIFLLWQNSPAIIVGRNQNTMQEINYDFVTENNIPVVRRLSGGGAVFHDLGNINFTFIANNADKYFNNYAQFTAPIINALKKLDVNASLSGRNDMVIEDKKFSGNAQYLYKKRLLHHGTILFSSNITDLSASLKVNPQKVQSKGIKSVVSRVTNIDKYLKTPMSVPEFIDFIEDCVVETNKKAVKYELSREDIAAIGKLRDEKYSTWDWNFASSPKYSFNKSDKFDGGTVEVSLDVIDGIIKHIAITGDFFSKTDISEITTALIGTKHTINEVKIKLNNYDIDMYFSNIKTEDLISVIF